MHAMIVLFLFLWDQCRKDLGDESQSLLWQAVVSRSSYPEILPAPECSSSGRSEALKAVVMEIRSRVASLHEREASYNSVKVLEDLGSLSLIHNSA